MAALSSACRVQGFKVGPDYIDPGYHTAASGRISRNLDTWMLSPAQVQVQFARAAADADIAIVEGVMGLFDGYDGRSESGSTAEVAKLLRAPVILIVDVAMMARSAAALALGYRDYDPLLRVAGVVCNNVAGEQHARWVREAIEGIGLPVLGCLPQADEMRIPERHLGLQMAVERPAELPDLLQRLAQAVAAHVDLGRLWEIARAAEPWTIEVPYPLARTPARVRIAVARDEAFCFYYEDNLELLRAAGAEIVTFSPLRDPELPAGCAGLYLGGGYPELYGEQLSGNIPLRQAIRAAHRAGMPIYAECGGLMFLTESISDLAGRSHPMVGLLPGRSRLREQLVMGYRTVTAERTSLLLAPGEQVRGHEFHCSDWVDQPPDLPYAYEIAPAPGAAPRREGFAHGSLLASYIHLHFGTRPDLAPNLVRACECWWKERAH